MSEIKLPLRVSGGSVMSKTGTWLYSSVALEILAKEVENLQEDNTKLVDVLSDLTKSILDNVTLEYMDEMTEGRMTKAIDAILAVKENQ